MMVARKKLIEVALPLEAINKASAREKSIRHGHPSTLHLWWARRPLAAARAVIFSQMVDDPSEHTATLLSDPGKKRAATRELGKRRVAWSERKAKHEEARRRGDHSVSEPGPEPTLKDCVADIERERLFEIIRQLVLWENTTNEKVLQQARDEIWQSWRYTCAENAGHPRAKELFDRYKLPAFHDPFAGGGALPLEAQRLGLESYASDLNPVAVLINKAMIEIPPKFANKPPVNPDAQQQKVQMDKSWRGAQGLGEDVRYYGQWMRDEAEKRIGHLYPKVEITAEMAKERPDLKPLVGQDLTVVAWLWARTVKSPNPAFAKVDVPLVSSFLLSPMAGKEAYVDPVIEDGDYRFTVKVGKPKDAEGAKSGTKLSRGSFRCLISNVPIPYEYIDDEANVGRMAPYVEREFASIHKDKSLVEARRMLSADDRLSAKKPIAQWDAAVLLKVIWDAWNDVFGRTLGRAERSLVQELREVRNRWAHQETFSSDDAYRSLDSVHRLMLAVSAPQAEEVEKMKMELLRVRFDEQARGEKRKSAGTAIESGVTGNLKPWREVVTPHKDVASGRYQQAEFAADLWQVHVGEGADEYKNPMEFFRRTYLTESLKGMLVGAVRRLTAGGGDPVVQLQTNFGGGKTHSMLALYHLFSSTPPNELAGIDAVMQASGAKKLPPARRVVLVGNKISPGNPSTKLDGTVVRTLWGEIAWQLGGKKAFARVKADDEKATSPGDRLRELFNDYGPCLILIDEWVAYARQLHDQSDLPAGSFETQFTFAQVLTESAKMAKSCLLVISLPASDTSGSPHTQANDVEVGGQRGREALDRLRNVIGRVESSWRPASAEEGFEIVRRRLFEPMTDAAQFKERDVVSRAFADFYRAQQAEFPPECRDADYEKRIKAAYPIHPEIFDRLYTDWSTLVKFQRTRGVLRLMAGVIHSLWEKGDRNPLILPANVSIDDPRVQFELTRYLSDNWVPVIEKDVDGPNSLPLRLDSEVPNLGKFSACRRVARAIYMGSAPTTAAAHRGIEDRRVKLGCVMPGESPAVFGDALRRLAAAATYLYQDGPHYWYSTQPTVTKLAEDRADQIKRDHDKVVHELEKRLRHDLTRMGDFNRVHPMPQSGQDVPDDFDARLVVLGVDHAYSKDSGNPAETAAKAILESRGNTPRLFRNTLVFLAPDKTRLQDLEDATCKCLAWESILREQEQLDLSPFQVKQAETQKSAADSAVTARLPETYQWLLVPGQSSSPQAPVTWEALRLSGQDALAVRASKKLRSDELLLTSFASTLLRMEMDRVPLWRGDHVAIKQLVEDFARYLYLPRLKDSSVLMHAIGDGVALMTWEQDSFGFAESFDESAGRYRGLRGGQYVALVDAESSGLLVKAATARKQLDAERAEPPVDGSPAGPTPSTPRGDQTGTPSPPSGRTQPKRFHGTVTLDSTRVGRDASRIAEEVISHLGSLVGADVKVTLEIEAVLPSGAPENVVRTVTENSRTLKFTSQGFEEE